VSPCNSETAEPIPDDDQVSRAYFEIPDEVDPESQFPFTYKSNERAESVFWRKYAPTISEVHERGCRLEKIKNARRTKALKYIGSRSALVAAIRQIKSGRGHKFKVIHVPEDGDRAHAHICIEPAPGVTAKQVEANDIRELVSLLFRHFGNLEGHTCPS
jgi:hypothetical protein